MLPSELQDRIGRDQIYRETFETTCNSQNKSHFLDKAREYVEFVVDRVRKQPRTEFPIEFTSLIRPDPPFDPYLPPAPSPLPIDAYSSADFRHWLLNENCPPPEPEEPFDPKRWIGKDSDAGAPPTVQQLVVVRVERADRYESNHLLLKQLSNLIQKADIFSQPRQNFWSFRPEISRKNRERLNEKIEYADWMIRHNSRSAAEVYLSKLEADLEDYSQPSWGDKLKAESILLLSALGIFAISGLFLGRMGVTTLVESSPSTGGEIISLTARIAAKKAGAFTNAIKAAAAFLISFAGVRETKR